MKKNMSLIEKKCKELFDEEEFLKIYENFFFNIERLLIYWFKKSLEMLPDIT